MYNIHISIYIYIYIDLDGAVEAVLAVADVALARVAHEHLAQPVGEEDGVGVDLCFLPVGPLRKRRKRPASSGVTVPPEQYIIV